MRGLRRERSLILEGWLSLLCRLFCLRLERCRVCHLLSSILLSWKGWNRSKLIRICMHRIWIMTLLVVCLVYMKWKGMGISKESLAKGSLLLRIFVWLLIKYFLILIKQGCVCWGSRRVIEYRCSFCHNRFSLLTEI